MVDDPLLSNVGYSGAIKRKFVKLLGFVDPKYENAFAYANRVFVLQYSVNGVLNNTSFDAVVGHTAKL